MQPPVENHPRPEPRPFYVQPARGILALCFAVLIAMLASACGGGSDEAASDNPNVIDAGQIGQIQLPDDDPPAPPPPPAAATETSTSGDEAEATDETAADEADDDAETEPEEEEVDDEAIPLAEDDQPAVLGLIDAFDDFTTCFDREGFEFIGVPGQDGPPEDFPTGYPEALGTCAASSNIIQAVQDAEAENAELSPEEIEERNEAYFVFEDCLKGKGWDPQPPVPDQYGVLFAENGDFGQPDNVDDPIGPIRECASEAAAPLLEAEDG